MDRCRPYPQSRTGNQDEIEAVERGFDGSLGSCGSSETSVNRTDGATMAASVIAARLPKLGLA